MYITYDLDAEQDVKRALERIGLKQEDDYCAIGIKAAGSDCIEGLLPATVKQKVFSDNYETVVALGSQDPNIRRSAKNTLKQKFLDEFRAGTFREKDLSDFKAMSAKIAKAFE